jgi:hypothetical protein
LKYLSKKKRKKSIILETAELIPRIVIFFAILLLELSFGRMESKKGAFVGGIS